MADENSSEKAAKLLIDDPSDFGFRAAYLAYSKAWDENLDEGARLELNKALQSLAENKGEYSAFYDEIGRYRKNESNEYPGRIMFKAQKKSAWRKSEAKKDRILRHKK